MVNSLFLSKLTPRTMFLVDFIGALVSSFMLGIVLVQFQPYIGMPTRVLYFLSGLAFSFFLFSAFNYYKASAGGQNRRPDLRVIALLNTAYCLLSLVLMIYFRTQLTLLGFAYFICEKIIVLSLAYIEWKVATNRVSL